MKRLLALLLCLSLLLPVFSLAEDDEEDIDLFGSEDLDDVEIGEDGKLVFDGSEDMSDTELSDSFMEQMAEVFTADESVDPNDLYLNTNLPDEDFDGKPDVINILLVGLDSKGTSEKKLLSEQGQYAKRADVQMILSINRLDGTIKLTSIARNTYVNIPDRTKNSSICNSWGHGLYENGKYVGWADTPTNCIATVNLNFELDIQYYVATNFYGVVSIIELLGGVDLELTKTEAKAINTYLSMKTIYKYNSNGEIMRDSEGNKMTASHGKAIANTYDDKKGVRDELEVKDGVQHLDGLQALIYARTREIDNDFYRTGRTRKLLSALLTPTVLKIKHHELDLEELLLDQFPRYFKTNMNLSTMKEVIELVLNSDIVSYMDAADSMIEEYRIPEDGAWGYGTDDSGSSVVKMSNKQNTVERLHEFIYGAYYPSGR